MTQRKERPRPSLPRLGMAGVAFASLLVIVDMGPSNSPALMWAIACFVVGIPLVIAAFSLQSAGDKDWPSWAQSRVLFAVGLVEAIGDVTCAVGVYHLIRHLSPEAALTFLQLSLALWVGPSLAWGGLNFLGARERKRQGPNQVDGPAKPTAAPQQRGDD